MSGNRNLQEFLYTVKVNAPKLLGFDHIGILFHNKTGMCSIHSAEMLI